MGVRATSAAIVPWALRGLMILLALSAPIVTYRAFTDPETSDPLREERLREARESQRRNGERPTSSPAIPEPIEP